MNKKELREIERKRRQEIIERNRLIKSGELVRCMVFRPRELGCSGDEYIERDKIPAGITSRKFMNIRMPWLIQAELNGQYLPVYDADEVYVTPEKVARIPGCEPWQRLKAVSMSLWDQIKPAYPVIALIIAGIISVMVLG